MTPIAVAVDVCIMDADWISTSALGNQVQDQTRPAVWIVKIKLLSPAPLHPWRFLHTVLYKGLFGAWDLRSPALACRRGKTDAGKKSICEGLIKRRLGVK
jgi:hypothetical protein